MSPGVRNFLFWFSFGLFGFNLAMGLYCLSVPGLTGEATFFGLNACLCFVAALARWLQDREPSSR